MTAAITLQPMEVNGLIREYLTFGDYVATVNAFDAECEVKGSLPDAAEQLELIDSAIAYLETTESRFMNAFLTGNRKAFFQAWDESLGGNTSHDLEFKKMDFLINIYFAVFPVHPAVDETAAKTLNLSSTMQAFKLFLETSGAELAAQPEFLPYYALPYLPNPRDHPSFQEIFSDFWVADLEERLRGFLRGALKASAKPRLVAILEKAKAAQTEPERPKITSEEHQAVVREVEEFAERERSLMQRHRSLQTDYHSLITIASELVQTLTASINGEKITSQYLAGICQRLAGFKQNQQSVALKAGDMRDYQPRVPISQHMDVRSNSPVNNHVARAADPPEASAGHVQQDIRREEPPPPSPKVERLEEFLDYDAIVRDLTPSLDPRLQRYQGFVLQALRQHLTNAPTASRRSHIISVYLSQDFLRIATGKNPHFLLDLFDTPSTHTRVQIAKLVNTLASHHLGREYLLKQRLVIPRLIEYMRNEPSDTVFRKNLLGTLQKLSLRRAAQSAMNNAAVIGWVLDVLETGGLSDYSLEYATALLMNLCLRTDGKRQCRKDAERTIKILMTLTEYDNIQVKTYINGALFSLLSDHIIRDTAHKLGMPNLLKYLRQSSGADLVRQIDFVAQQLHSEESEGISDVVSEDGEEDDFEDDEEIADDESEDSLLPTPEESCGAALLASKYRQSKPNTPYRPVISTPTMRRTVSSHSVVPTTIEELTRPRTPIRPSTPSRPGTPLIQSHRPSITGALQRAPAALRSSSINVLTVNPAQNESAASGKPPTQNRKGRKMSKKIVPVTDEEQYEFDAAFSTRPRLARTPITGNSRQVSIASSVG